MANGVRVRAWWVLIALGGRQGLSSVLTAGAPSDTAVLHLTGVLNPLSIEAHEASVAASVLVQALPNTISVQFELLPDRGIGVLPLDRFYRYLLQPEPRFDSDDGSRVFEQLVFSGLPSHPTLTLGAHVLGTWMVGAAGGAGGQDLDNLVLGKAAMSGPVEVTIALENLVVEGDGGPDSTGTQLYLGVDKEEHSSDTVVMATRNYFQLKASPGQFVIHAAPPAVLEKGPKGVILDSWRGV